MIFKIKKTLSRVLFGRRLTKVRMKKVIKELQKMSQKYYECSLAEMGEDVTGNSPLVQYYKGKHTGIKETLAILEPFYNDTIN
jgi:hypothetical protein